MLYSHTSVGLDLPLLLRVTGTILKSVRVHFAYGSDGRSCFVEYS